MERSMKGGVDWVRGEERWRAEERGLGRAERGCKLGAFSFERHNPLILLFIPPLPLSSLIHSSSFIFLLFSLFFFCLFSFILPTIFSRMGSVCVSM